MNMSYAQFRLKTFHLLVCLICAGSVCLSPLGSATALAVEPYTAAPRQAAAPLAVVYYVDASAPGGGDGLSWATAFQTLQAGLAAASSGDEVWVAEGVYTPGAPGNRAATFTLKEGVKVYGGFAGGESLRAERDPERRRTILSGDLQGDDSGMDNKTDNSYHVVTALSGITHATLLDGFTIQGGYADGSDPDNNGGGMRNVSSEPVLFRITFLGNFAAEGGGAMHNSGSNPRIYSCTFINNLAGEGGAIYNASGSAPRVVSTVLNANQADKGGAIFNASGSSLDMSNATVAYNSAPSGGGGIYNATSGPKVKNSILWGNSAASGAQIFNSIGYTFELQQSLVQGGEPAYVQVTGVLLTMDPQFVDWDGLDDQPGTLDDNLRLKFTSPAIDSGDNSLVHLDAYDLNENGSTSDEAPDRDVRARRVEIVFVVDAGPGSPLVDLGAYEARVLYVKKTASGLDNGVSWLNAYRSLSNALSKAATGDELWVAQGVYTPTLPLATPTVSDTFRIRQGLALYGGFAGNEVVRNQRKPLTYRSILSGDLAGNDNGFTNNGENSLNVVRMSNVDQHTVLDGFTIQGGNARYSSSSTSLLNEQSMSRFLYEQINAPLGSPLYTSNGGGMYLEQASPLLVNLTFFRNYGMYGGGVHSRNGAPQFFNCAWIGNEAVLGGGLWTTASDAQVVTALFNGNRTEGQGGGVYILSSSPLFVNVTFSQNDGDLRGEFVMDGDAVHVTQPSSKPFFRNAVFWGHDDEPFNFDSGGTATLNYVISQTGCPAGATCTNLRTTDPLFFNPLGMDGQPGTLDDDFRIPFGSPARDMGSNFYLPADIWDINNNGNTSEKTPYDLALQPRLQGVAPPYTVDLGAYEAVPFKTFLPVASHP